jgi:membrane associated rhomboid family serine protease
LQCASSLREWLVDDQRLEFGLTLKRGTRSLLPCPRCRNSLCRSKFSAATIHHCLACSLIWLPPAEAAKMPLRPERGWEQGNDWPSASLEGIKWGPHPPLATLALLSCFLLISYLLWKREIPDYLVCFPRDPLRYFGLPLALSLFTHGSLAHLAGNAYFLLHAGSALETHLGWQKLLLLFFLSGLGAKLSQALFTDMGSLGASGAVSGVLVALAASQPNALYVFRPTAFLRGVPVLSLLAVSIRIPIWLCVAAWFGWDAFAMGYFQGEAASGVGHAAHLGGGLTGALLSLQLLPSAKEKAA